MYYEIIAVDPPYLVDRQTGEVTTADTFTGRSGEVDRFTVVAYDNEGAEPSFTSTAVLMVSAYHELLCVIEELFVLLLLKVRVFKECQQIIAVADQPQEQAETCRTQLETLAQTHSHSHTHTFKNIHSSHIHTLLLCSAIANETGHIIYITKIRVHQDEQLNVVDTTRWA